MNRVLHIVRGMGAGGIETFLMNIYRTIDRKNIQFDFLVYTKTEEFYDKEILDLGGIIHHLPPRRNGIVKNFKALNEFFRTHPEYKVIHYHVSSLTDITPLVVATKYKVPMRIVHSHNTMQSGFPHKCFHKFNQCRIKRYATHYFGCSEVALRWLYGDKMVDAGQCEVINNAINVERFRYDVNARSVIRSTLSLNNEQLVVGCIGRFSHQKNHAFLLDIFAKIVKQNSDSKLLLIGRGELEDVIREKMQILGIEDNVEILSNRSDIPQLLSMMDVLVMPSFHEGLPVVLIEAQANGITCIVSTSVTTEVKIIDSMQFVSLSKSVEEWAEIVIDRAKDTRDIRAVELVAHAGYDIINVASYLQSLYLNAYN